MCCLNKSQDVLNIHKKNTKESYKNNKFKISLAWWTGIFELHVVLNSVSDVQDYFDYINKRHGKKSNNPPKNTCKKYRK